MTTKSIVKKKMLPYVDFCCNPCNSLLMCSGAVLLQHFNGVTPND
jgi:hypothetical protein